ncbi:riboflavin synthase subunit alpha [Sphingorhabdus lutea]|uniref:Riboflavin synthase n=1 Tax=Sphingorhabdus lutea TaxID=1913578 RepID=A0A1L3J9Z4_9SPHN|nr:riboflavin synthase [Sphingorhabdus lutea]APG61940.1 riboflavin synthase subunit alpha [Sphingorhabdus lutea]
MFTGIITDIGTINKMTKMGDTHVTINCHQDMDNVTIGASIACSGVCLTVVEKGIDDNGPYFSVDVSDETINCTSSAMWHVGAKLNLERALCVGDELGGHIVTGHVDGVGRITKIENIGGSLGVTVKMPDELAPYVAAKGSITVDGISLTVNRVMDAQDGHYFMLNIIPHTAEVTSFADIKEGQEVNLEIDVLARYLKRMEDLRS